MIFLFPRLNRARDIQIGNRETREARFRLRAATGCAFIANLTAAARRRACVRRNTGRVIVGFHFHQRVSSLRMKTVRAIGIGKESFDDVAFHHCRIVGIGDHRAFRIFRMSGAHHAEQ